MKTIVKRRYWISGALLFGLLLLTIAGWKTIHYVSAQSNTPVFGNAVIAHDFSQGEQIPIDALPTLPSGVAYMVAVMPLQNVPDGSVIDVQWYKNGQVYLNPVSVTLTADAFNVNSSLTKNPANPLGAGQYEVRFSYQGKVVGQADVTLADGPFIYPIRFGDDCGAFSTELINPRNSFPQGTKNIGATAQLANIPNGSVVNVDWSLADQTIAHATLTVNNNPPLCATYHQQKGLANGMYTLKLSLNGTVLQTGNFQVGS